MTSCSGRIWSLWDMREIKMRQLVSTVAQLERIEVLMSERKGREDFLPDAPVPASVRHGLAGRFNVLAKNADALGATIAAKSARRAVAKLRARKEIIGFAELEFVTMEVANVLRDEVAKKAMVAEMATRMGVI